MSPIVLALFNILLLAVYTQADQGFYSVVGPGTIRSNYKYNVAVTLHKADVPSEIRVGITGPSYNETKVITLEPMSTGNVEFDVPSLVNGDYNLTVMGLSGITFENTTRLNYADHKPLVFIQTDKATYKPGDLVQFRVLFLNANTRPANIEEPINIQINDGAQNLIKQLENVKLTKGVYSGEFQLSEEPVLGDWNIEVLLGDDSAMSKSFEVAKYVLPKFEVVVESPKDVAYADGTVKVTVRAKYTYGKSVKGKATVSIKPRYHYYGRTDAELEAEKTVDIDGKTHVEFDILAKLKDSLSTYYIPPLTILAVVEEELTGNKQNGTATVMVHRERFKIHGLDVPYTFMPSKPIIMKIAIQNLDGSPVQDTKNPVKLIIEPPRSYFARESKSESTKRVNQSDIILESPIGDNGVATFEFQLEDNGQFYSVKCVYLDTTTHITSLSKYEPQDNVPELLSVKVKTEKPHLRKDIMVEIKSSEKIPYFVYTLVARGNIIMMERVEVPAERNSYTLKLKPTFEMVPKATLFVHYIFNNNLRFEEVNINMEKEFENSINIEAPVQAKPGEDVEVKVNTDPDSFVGLLGVDQSVLLLKSGNDLSKDDIFNRIDNFETSTPWQRGFGQYPGQMSGLVTLTNAHYPFNNVYSRVPYISYSSINRNSESLGFPAYAMPQASLSGGIGHKKHKAIAVRKDFAENWLFLNYENTDANGFTLKKKIPDTITSWVLTGFSLNPKTGLALTENPSKIQVFQPFFVSTNLPYSVKRGEVIAIPVITFNYMDKELVADITMDNSDKEFEFTEATNEIEVKPTDEVERVKRLTVPPGSGKSISFMIRPKKVGFITLKITAVTPLAGDAIHQMLRVDPEGVTQYANRAVFVNLNENPEQTGQLNVDLPETVVPDSEYIEFSSVGDILGPIVKNLDKLVRMPYGCGEQNMVNFVPNILVLSYLEATNRKMPTIIEKAKKFLDIGYQRELTYKHDDGSYSAFGKSDKAGSTWLTAYVVRSFHQAAKYTDIDRKVITAGLDFLASKQAENGSFPEYGKLFDSTHQSDTVLTAFVILAFLENDDQAHTYEAQIQKGLDYVTKAIQDSDDVYELATAAFALQLAKHPEAEKVLSKLQSMAKEDHNLKWWSKMQKVEAAHKPWYWKPRSKDVEITSYALLALLEKNSAEDVLPVIRWLISQRNSMGGFSSTQDTVVGLQALIKFASKTNSGSGTMDIEFTSGGDTNKMDHIDISPENSLVLQTYVLPKSTRQVNFTAKGKGSALVQLSYKYNIADPERRPSFKVNTNVLDNTPPRQLIVEVCAEYVPLEDANESAASNMAVMEVALPSGYTAETESFDKIKSVEDVKRTETKNSDSTVIIYFDSLSKGDIKCVPIEATKTHAVAKQKPAAVSVYDYYDPEKRATEYYQIKSSLCDICDSGDCGEGCAQQ